MTHSHQSREQDSLYLPQYGFGESIDFARLVEHNPFLFRVYTPKECSPFFDDSEPFFIAPRFDERCRNPSPGGLTSWEVDGPAAIANATYHDAVRHMDWTTRSLSPFISTSFSAIWSIWEAVRRYRHGVKQDVQIAIIDASAISHRAVTTASLLSKASPQERRDGYWKWFRYSQESQTVLVYGAIPGTAILASVPLSDLLRRLPSYFVKESTDKSNPFSRLAWDYTQQKANFRIFCRDMSKNFLRQPRDERFQDATTNAVELAIAFLRPWFHQTVFNATEQAIEKVSMLAFLIAQWPCQWWIREHTEIQDLISGMVGAIAEELQEKNKSKDVSRLQEVVDDLEHTLVEYQGRLQQAESQVVKYHKLATSLKQRRAKESLQDIQVINHLPTPDASPAFNRKWTINEAQVPLPESPLSTKAVLPQSSSLQSLEYYDREVNEVKIPLPGSPLPTEASLPLKPVLVLNASAESNRDDAWAIDESKIPLPESPLLIEFRQQTGVILPTPHASPEHRNDRAGEETKIPLFELLLPAGISLLPNAVLEATPSLGEPLKSQTIDAWMVPLPESPPSAEASLPSMPTPLASTPKTPIAQPWPRPSSLTLDLSQLPLSEDALSPSTALSLTPSTLAAGEEDETSTVLSTPPGKEAIKLLESPKAKSRDLPSKDDSEPETSASHHTLVNDDDVAELEGIEVEEEYVWVSEDEEFYHIQRTPPFVETASYIATGFLVGAVITLSLLSHRRVPLLTAT